MHHKVGFAQICVGFMSLWAACCTAHPFAGIWQAGKCVQSPSARQPDVASQSAQYYVGLPGLAAPDSKNRCIFICKYMRVGFTCKRKTDKSCAGIETLLIVARWESNQQAHTER